MNELPAIADPSPASETAPDARSCVRCGYSLIGFSEETGRRPCPECGLLSGLSFLDARELRNNRPRWLRGLAWGAALTAAGLLGLWLSVAGLPLLIDWHDLNAYARYYSQRNPHTSTWAGDLYGTQGEAVAIGGLLAAGPLLLWLGVVVLTGPSGRHGSDVADWRSRWALRGLALLPLAAIALTSLTVAEALPPILMNHAELLLVAAAVMCCPLPVVLFGHLKRLAARAPAPLLAADSPIVGWTLGAALLLPLIFVAGGQITDALGVALNRGVVSDAAILAFGVAIAVGFAAYLWSLYLLVRYALAFGKSARQAREVWATNDLARDDAGASE